MSLLLAEGKEALFGFDPGNMTAIAAFVSITVYIVTRGIPNLVEKFHQNQIAERADFKDALKSEREDNHEAQEKQRNAFRDELQTYRTMSQSLAESGHRSVDNLAEKIDELRRGLETKSK